MALTPERIDEIAGPADYFDRRVFARAIEAEVRKADTELIRQMLSALTDLVEAGEEAWGEDRPCVRIGKEEITAARERLEQS